MKMEANTKEQLKKELIELRTRLAELELLKVQEKWIYGRIKAERWKLDAIINSLPNGISIISEDCKVLFQNRWLHNRFGNKVGKLCYKEYMKRGKPCPDCPVRRAIKNKRIEQCEEQAGDGRYYRLIAVPFGKFEGKTSGVEIIIDITEQRLAQEAFLQSQEKYADLINNLNVGVYRNTPGAKGRFLEANPAMVSMFEAESKGEFLKHSVSDLYQYPNKRKKFSKKLLKFGYVKNEELELKTLSGRKFWGSITSVKREYGDGNVYFDGIVEDITERKWAEKELLKSNKLLKQLALRDSHTGLYNRRYLKDFIEAEFYRAKRYEHPVSVIMLDVDYFKSINDVYGHKFGDLALRQLASQLKKLVRRGDIIVRFGGEEFIIISPRINRADVFALAQRILEAVKSYNFGNKKITLKLKLTAAVASFPEDKITDGMDLIEFADQLLKRAKEDGGDRVYSSVETKMGIPALLEKGEESPDVKSMKNKIGKLIKRVNQNIIEEVFAFGKTSALKDGYTVPYVERTAYYAAEIAKSLGLPQDKINHIRTAYILHDLGKVGINNAILRKRVRLNSKEFDEIKKHPQIAADIIRPIQSLRDAVPSILYHHERWDAKGYPKGLGGEEVPVGARIVAVVDAYQALTSDRPYRKAYSKDEAIEIIKKNSGTHFDPDIVDVFSEIIQGEGK